MNSRIGSLTAAIITIVALAAVPQMSAQEENVSIQDMS